MKTRCPDCQTVFRITAEQLAARAGKVRCGHCRKVFNALDDQFEGPLPAVAPTPMRATAPEPLSSDLKIEPKVTERRFSPSSQAPGEDGRLPPYDALSGSVKPEAEPILPRETREIPGYSKWAEGPIGIPSEKSSRRPFRLAAAVLSLVLVGQAVFHFRGELAILAPRLRPALDAFSRAVDGPLPLPEHAELISIETSDLQTDLARGRLLVLNTTLRNKAPYGQAYPSLELWLTDTQDKVLARRVFSPQDYLPAEAAALPAFPPNVDVAVRLWLEAVNLGAAGYRLFVFYP